MKNVLITIFLTNFLFMSSLPTINSNANEIRAQNGIYAPTIPIDSNRIDAYSSFYKKELERAHFICKSVIAVLFAVVLAGSAYGLHSLIFKDSKLKNSTENLGKQLNATEVANLQQLLNDSIPEYNRPWYRKLKDNLVGYFIGGLSLTIGRHILMSFDSSKEIIFTLVKNLWRKKDGSFFYWQARQQLISHMDTIHKFIIRAVEVQDDLEKRNLNLFALSFISSLKQHHQSLVHLTERLFGVLALVQSDFDDHSKRLIITSIDNFGALIDSYASNVNRGQHIGMQQSLISAYVHAQQMLTSIMQKAETIIEIQA